MILDMYTLGDGYNDFRSTKRRQLRTNFSAGGNHNH